MAYRSTQESRRSLYALASLQGGYFTAKQARGVGYDYPHLAYHLKSGNIRRAGRGLYRLPELPTSEHDDLVRLSLWSRDRNDAPQAVASHETALALHGLSDVLPPRTHLTVPPSFRKEAPRGCVLHRSRLASEEVEEHEAFRLTSPLRTLLDVAAGSAVTSEQIERAVAEALRRGLVRRSQLQAAARAAPTAAARLGVVAQPAVAGTAGVAGMAGLAAG